MPELTFFKAVAGYEYEGAHILYWLVHPFRPVLAAGDTRGGSAPDRVAHISAAAPHRHYRERGVCVDSSRVVFTGEVAGWEKDIARTTTYGTSNRRQRTGDIPGALGIVSPDVDHQPCHVGGFLVFR